MMKGLPSQKEKRRYPQGVVVVCNKKAWMNKEVWEVYVKHFARKIRALKFRTNGEIVFLYSNQLKSHEREATKEYLRGQDVLQRSLIANETHHQQAVDQHVGRFIQLEVQSCFRQETRRIEDLIDGGGNAEKLKLTLGKLRVLTSKWVLQAWKKIKRNENGILEKAWRNFGLYHPCDGSLDDKLVV